MAGKTTPLIKEQYLALQKRYRSLPDYDSLNFHFEISSITPGAFVLRDIKRKIASTLEPTLGLLEHFISPDPHHFASLYESSCFSHDEKKQLSHLYRHLMEQHRALFESSLINDPKKDAHLIKKIHAQWTEDKKQLLPYLSKLREFWHKHVEPKQILEYFG